MWGFGWVPLVIFFIVLRGVFGWGWGSRRWYRRYGYWGGGPYGDGRWGYGGGHAADAEATLRDRLAKGEIDEAEYQRLLEILRR